MKDIRLRLPTAFEVNVIHWRSLPRVGPLPDLSSYLDNADPQVQPWIGIVDVGPSGAQPIRLMGTGLVEYFGIDATGYDFLSIVAEHALPYLREAHSEIPRFPCGVYFSGMCSTSTGREVILEGLGLPYQVKSGACIAWHLRPISRLGFSEKGLRISEIIDATYVDLGVGVPEPRWT